ncbi:MAG: hypothetical protein HYS12_26890 [Planctomycetes bacterium]|nr:hypothetical protein [Planctomycetota bacterium]
MSPDDLYLSAELLSGHRIHESNVAGLTTEEWLDRWQRFRKCHPGYFPLAADGEATELERKNSTYYFELGQALSAKRDFDGAAAADRQALALSSCTTSAATRR